MYLKLCERMCQNKYRERKIKVNCFCYILFQLQRELGTARSEVATLHTDRDSYEENMKKAFMRGVCALNMGGHDYVQRR